MEVTGERLISSVFIRVFPHYPQFTLANSIDIAARMELGPARTRNVCLLVTLDLRNAFNTLQVPVIDEVLRKKSTPEYLVKKLLSWQRHFNWGA